MTTEETKLYLVTGEQINLFDSACSFYHRLNEVTPESQLRSQEHDEAYAELKSNPLPPGSIVVTRDQFLEAHRKALVNVCQDIANGYGGEGDRFPVYLADAIFGKALEAKVGEA